MRNDIKIEETVTITKAEYESLKQQIAYLMEQLKLSRHKRFGASGEQTEADGAEQLSLFNEAEKCADLTLPEPEITEVKAHYRKRTRLTTDKLPEDLPVETLLYTIPDEAKICPDCGCAMHKMGEEHRDELKIIPARISILRHLRYVYSCRHCEHNAESVPIVKAEIPEPVITVPYDIRRANVINRPLGRLRAKPAGTCFIRNSTRFTRCASRACALTLT
jgi:hypothetical protein